MCWSFVAPTTWFRTWSAQVELRGLEPLTPTLPVWCATSCATAPCRPGLVCPSRRQPYRPGNDTQRGVPPGGPRAGRHPPGELVAVKSEPLDWPAPWVLSTAALLLVALAPVARRSPARLHHGS